MTLTLIPDAEKITHAFLSGHPEIDTRIVGEPPSSTDESWVIINQIGAPDDSTSSADHLVAFTLQVSCYSSKVGDNGSQQKEASDLGRTVRAALKQMPATTHQGAVVSKVRIPGDARSADPSFEPARARRVLTATIWMHAT